MRRVVRSADERARLLEAHKTSGLSVGAFAEKEGISPSTLYGWLSGPRPKPPQLRIAKVIRRASGPAEGVSSAVVIEIGAARVRVPRGVDLATLDAVLGALLGKRTAP